MKSELLVVLSVISAELFADPNGMEIAKELARREAQEKINERFGSGSIISEKWKVADYNETFTVCDEDIEAMKGCKVLRLRARCRAEAEVSDGVLPPK